MEVPANRPKSAPRLPRMAELVADQLRARIVSGDLNTGDLLPREAVLVEEFGVSRPSLREAVRILETEGLLRIRRGKFGGAIVKRPDADSAAYHLGLSLQARGTTLADVAVARSVLEPVCAGLLAALPDESREEAVRGLTVLVDEAENTVGQAAEFTALAIRFHSALTGYCGNTTMSVLCQVVNSVWISQGWEQYPMGRPMERPHMDIALHAHREIVRAIANGSADSATRLMRDHNDASQIDPGYLNAAVEIATLPL